MYVVHCCLGGRRPGPYSDRPPNYDSGAAKSPYGGARSDGYSSTGYGSYGSTCKYSYNYVIVNVLYLVE